MPDAHQPHASLMEYLKELPDPRINRTKDHELLDLFGHRHLHVTVWRRVVL
jgi:hypothetical protein